MKNMWFPLYNLSFNDSILLKFIWYLTINRIQVRFEQKDYASIGKGLWSLTDMKKCIFFVSAQSLKYTTNEWIILKFIWYNNILVEFERGGYVSTWTGFLAPNRSEKKENVWFSLNWSGITAHVLAKNAFFGCPFNNLS